MYSSKAYFAFLKHEYVETFSYHNWSCPPHALLYTWLLGYFSYFAAYALWCVGGIATFYYACHRLTGHRYDSLVLALAPCTFVNISYGQNGFITGSLILLSFAVMKPRPILAGVLIGLLTFKPQLGVLFPILLLMLRQWTVIISASVTTVCLFAASALAFGLEPWGSYFIDVMPLQKIILQNAQAPFSDMVPSLYMTGKTLGLGDAMSMSLQTISTVFAILGVIWVWGRARDYALQIAFSCVAILLLSPYVVIYDMMVIAPAAYLYYQHMAKQPNKSHVVCGSVALFVGFLPITSQGLSAQGFPIGSIVMLAFGILLINILSKLPSQSLGPWYKNAAPA